MKQTLRSCPICGAEGDLAEQAVPDFYFEFPGAWDFAQCRSSTCGAMWQDPAPEDSVLAASYAQYYTHNSEAGGSFAEWLNRCATRIALFAGHRSLPCFGGAAVPVLSRLAEHLLLSNGVVAPIRHGKFLDIGCGSGERLPRLSALGWAEVIGVEPDGAAVESGRRRGNHIQLGQAEALPIATESVDVAFFHHVIEHVRSPAVALKEAWRVLKPGGCIVLLTPNITSHNRLGLGKYWRGFEAPRHLVLFGATSLRRAVEEAGFQEINIGSSYRSSAWVAGLADKFKSAGARSQGWLGRQLAAEGAVLQGYWARLPGRMAGDELVCLARKSEE